MRKFNSRKPFYESDTDFTTNTPSYYIDLARKNKLIKILAEKIAYYDEELAKRFEEWDQQLKELPDTLKQLFLDWVDDGTLARILAQLLLDDYATKEWVDNEIEEYTNIIIEMFEIFKDEIDTELLDFKNNVNDIINDFKNDIDKKLDNKSVEYTVGTNGDFDTLNASINHIRNLSIKPKKVTILILNDYVLRDQVLFMNEDLSFIKITSQGVVNVSIGVENVYKYDDLYPIFYAYNTRLPLFDVHFNYVDLKNGFNREIIGLLLDNSTVDIFEGKGFTNFPYIGVFGKNNSNIKANGSIFNNNGIFSDNHGAGIRVNRSSLSAEGSYANNCGEYGYWIQSGSSFNINGSTSTNCGHHNLVVSQGSNGTARDSIFTDCRDNGVVVTSNSSLDLSNSDCSRCGNNNIVVQYNSSLYFENGISNDSGISGLNVTKHSYASAQGATLKNNNRHGLDSKDGSDVNFLQGITEGNNGNGIYCLDGSKVACRSSKINDNGEQGIYCYGGFVDAYRAEIKGNTVSGIRSFNGGRVTADESDIQNNGSYGLHASRGEIWANRGICKNNNGDEWDISASWGGEITCQEVEVSSEGENIRCTSSSIIKASNVKGNAKANKPINMINEQGVIYGNNIFSDLDSE